MNILFISHLSGKLSTGPCWSVPASIKAQKKIDKVLWINWGNSELAHWAETGVFHKSSEFDTNNLCTFPIPFNRPDIVVFEGFYSIESVNFAKQLKKKCIPYIIIPRGSLTRHARNNKSKLKKNLAHVLLFNRFIKQAAAIQFLSKQEYTDSITLNTNYFIIPNGFNIPKINKSHFSNNSIIVVYIGRIDIYQKGLDLLVNACKLIADNLRKFNVKIVIYGPYTEDQDILTEQILSFSMDDLFFFKGEISGKAKEEILLDADVFILTSRSEGFSMGLVEALAYGVPVLVTKGSNLKDEIQNYDAGWGCDTEVESIKNALLQMISDKSVFYKKSANALSLARNYGWDNLASQLHNIIEGVINR